MTGFTEEQGLNLKEPVDRTKWIWVGIVLLCGIVVFIIWATSGAPTSSLVRAKHILIKFDTSDDADRSRALAEISDLRERIMAGESFDKLAKEFSNDSRSASRGGDLGYHTKGSFEEEFDAYVWSAPVGQLSDIIRTQYGFHLAVVTDRRLSKTDVYQEEFKRRVLEDDSESR